jgi:putative ABC transport system permease protein
VFSGNQLVQTAQQNTAELTVLLIGILLGFIAGFALTRGLGFPFGFSLMAVALAFSVSAVVGICFGYYPAMRAAKLDPIIALRTE